jgi:hypothetical protein
MAHVEESVSSPDALPLHLKHYRIDADTYGSVTNFSVK